MQHRHRAKCIRPVARPVVIRVRRENLVLLVPLLRVLGQSRDAALALRLIEPALRQDAPDLLDTRLEIELRRDPDWLESHRLHHLFPALASPELAYLDVMRHAVARGTNIALLRPVINVIDVVRETLTRGLVVVY